jgi:hypothetical protein
VGFYVLVQPEGNAAAVLVEHLPGHPSLIVDCGGSQISVQIAGRPNGIDDAIRFARGLADAATKFATRCEELTALPPVDVSELEAFTRPAPSPEVSDPPPTDT